MLYFSSVQFTNRVSQRIVFSILVFLCAVSTGMAEHITGKPIEREHSIYPTIPTEAIPESGGSRLWYRYACYSVYDGTYLDCAFSIRVVGPYAENFEDLAGHEHGIQDRPLIYPGDGKLEFAEDTNKKALEVAGQTKNNVATTSYKMPEASGKIEVEGMLFTQPSWYCMSNCYTETSRKFRDIVNVSVPNLVPLPDPSAEDDYIKVRKPDNNHSDAVAFYGTQLAIDTLQLIASEYFRLSGRKLSINDMSLPKGGKFDINGKWSGDRDHITHRQGVDADINRRADVVCTEDDNLLKAVDLVLPEGVIRRGEIRSARFCEKNEFIHIDLDYFAPAMG